MTTETHKQIDARIRERFDILNDFSTACTTGDCGALIVSGPPGLGKSFSVEKLLKDWDPTATQYTIVKGMVHAPGLLKVLYQHRFPNHVIVFDDADTIFWDETSLNLLKSVCDTCEERHISYLSEGKLVDEETGELIPKRFEVQSSIIFLTNLNFDKLIEKGHKVAPHLAALVSRSHYIDLAMHTKDDYLVRIEQVMKQGLLDKLPVPHRKEVMDFIYEHSDKLRELSLRMAIKVANIRQMNKPNWQAVARVTCCKV